METNSTLTAIVITKNESKRIEKCLQSISWAHETVVVDNGSSDDTVLIAKKCGAKVFSVLTGDFSQLRNYGKQHAKGNWLLYLDADEEATPALEHEIQTIINTFDYDSSPHGYFLKRNNIYLGHPWPNQDKMLRFFWKPSLVHWYGKLHETAKVEGSISTLKEPVVHDTHRTLEEMVEKTNAWSITEAELRFHAHHPRVVWWRLLRVMFTGFYGSFIQQGGWKAGTVGWIESLYQGYSMFITYAKLWELQQKD